MDNNKLKPWQGWALFGGSMVVVFGLGLLASSLLERRAEVASIFNNRRTPMEGIVAQNEKFKSDFPREYTSWKNTENTDFESEFNGSEAKDVLAQRPTWLFLWAGYAFFVNTPHPRHMHAMRYACNATHWRRIRTDAASARYFWNCKARLHD